MNKKNLAKVTGTSAAAFLIAGTTAFTAFAAMPEGTVVIGNKAFSLDYANLKANEKELREAVVAGGDIYVKAPNGTWFQNSGAKLTDTSVIPAVEFKAADGTVTKYDVKDGAVVTTPGTGTGNTGNINVSAVSAITTTTVTVTLADDTDVTKANDITNYSILVGQTPVQVTAVTYNSTTKRAVLTVALNNLEGKLKVNGTEGSFDFKAPAVNTITPVSSTVFDITFSEAVNAGLAQIKANYGIVETGTANTLTGNISTVQVLATNKVRVTMSSALVKDKSYTVSVAGMQDVSVNKNTMSTSSSGSFVAIKDETRPTLVSAVATDANKVELQMSEEMRTTVPTATLRKYNADGTLGTAITNSVVRSTSNVNKFELTITNSADYLVNGTKYLVELAGGADVEGNTIAENQKLDFIGKADDVAPTVLSSVFADGKLTITYSEAMNAVELTETDNYAVFETATGISETVTGVVQNTAADNKQAILSFSGLQAGKEYSVRIVGGTSDGLKDASITPNALANNTIVKFTVPTVTTTVQLAGAAQPGTPDGKSVELTFNTALVKAEAENIANYRIVETADETKTLAVTKAVYDTATNKVTLTTGSQVDGASKYKVYVSGLTNLSTKDTEYSATFNGVDKTKALLTGIQTLGLETIDLVFNENMKADQSAGVTVAVVEKGTANVVTPQALTASSGYDNKVRVKFAPGALTAGKTYTLTVTGAKDASVAANGSEANTMDFVATADTTAPTLVNAVSINAATIELTFNEEIIGTGLNATNFQLTKGTTPVSFGAGTTFTVDTVTKKKVTIVNGGISPVALLENGTAYTIKVVKDGSNLISDVAGNAITDASYSFTGVKDTTKPQLVSAVMKSDDDTKVVLTFSENLNAAVNPADFTVTVANTGVPVTVSGAVLGTLADANKVTLTLASSTVNGTQYRVFVNNANSSVKDLAVSPNLIDTNAAVGLFTGTDKTAPTVASTVLKGAKTVEITFNETINPASVSRTDFAVGGNTVSAATISDDLKTITLTLGTAVATDETHLAIAYAQDQSVTDFAGNKAVVSISGNTDAAAPVLQDVKVSAIGAGTSTITLVFSEDVAQILTGVTDSEIATVSGLTVTDITATGSSNEVVIEVAQDLEGLTPTVIVANTNNHITDGTNAYVGGDSVIGKVYVRSGVTAIAASGTEVTVNNTTRVIADTATNLTVDTTDAATLLGYITAPAKGTVEVFNAAKDTEKTGTDVLTTGDVVKVTAENGTVQFYTITFGA